MLILDHGLWILVPLITYVSPWFFYSYHLIVPKLCFDLECVVTFNSAKCSIQEKKSTRMLGLTDLVEGLYYLVIPQVSHYPTPLHIQPEFVFIPQTTLWYFRLGHLSNRRILSLHKHLPFINIDKDSVWDICHYAKHREIPFQLSVNKVNKWFVLIHFDI